MKAIELEIDGKTIAATENMTVLEAANAAGIAIPALCFHRPVGACNSCMVCAVRDLDKELIPACSTRARPGLRVDASGPEIKEFRRQTLELLLAEHVGDCDAPCRLSCPVFFNIPAALRQIAASNFAAAAELLHAGMPLPHLSCKLCRRRPCEKACRRGRLDSAIALADILHAALDIATAVPERRETKYAVAVVGAGCAGLAAADMLSKHGCRCVVFAASDRPGEEIAGLLEPAQRWLLENELSRLTAAGIEFKLSATPGPAEISGWPGRSFDAALLCVDGPGLARFKPWLEPDENGAFTKLQSFMTSISGVFAAEDMAIHASGIQAIADGVELGHAVIAWLEHDRQFIAENRYDHRFGEISAADMRQFAAGAGHTTVQVNDLAGAALEATRCLHCDCRKNEECRLRRLASDHAAQQLRMPDRRREFKRIAAGEIIYEPGKCIRCGICVKIGEAGGKAVAPVFNGRGHETEVGAPLGHSMEEALAGIGHACAAACPTGALAVIGPQLQRTGITQ